MKLLFLQHRPFFCFQLYYNILFSGCKEKFVNLSYNYLIIAIKII